MKKFKFLENISHIHFVGIGGISMSALAKFCLSRGIYVSGSDLVKSEIVSELVHLGANVFIGHRRSNVNNADLVVFTCAVGSENAEVKEAQKRHIKCMERADFLGEIANGFNNVIAVAGSHGKTTVTSMLSNIFVSAGLNPTTFVGGESGAQGNALIGANDYLIMEACEYQEHFLKFKHNTGVILNVDYDHPDYFKTEKNYQLAFEKFASGSLNRNVVNEKYKILLSCDNQITYGSGGNYYAKHIKYFDDKLQFDVYKNDKFFLKINLNLIGKYNIQNALCAVAVADQYKIPRSKIKQGLETYSGVKRRYEYMGKLNNNTVITDYAHHPTQILNCIKASREVYSKKITVVFEPHTYSRTLGLFSNFVYALSHADNIILMPTYSAREKIIKGGRSKDIYNVLKHKAENTKYIKTYSQCLQELRKLNDNIILILGAGSIIQLAETIKAEFLKQDTA